MTADLRDLSAAAWPWPTALDALSAAPRHHTLLLENERVRVLDSRAGGGVGSPPSVLWSAAMPPHSLENVGTAEILVISVEIKQVGGPL